MRKDFESSVWIKARRKKPLQGGLEAERCPCMRWLLFYPSCASPFLPPNKPSVTSSSNHSMTDPAEWESKKVLPLSSSSSLTTAPAPDSSRCREDSSYHSMTVTQTWGTGRPSEDGPWAQPTTTAAPSHNLSEWLVPRARERDPLSMVRQALVPKGIALPLKPQRVESLRLP